MPKLPGIGHQDAVRVFEKMWCKEPVSDLILSQRSRAAPGHPWNVLYYQTRVAGFDLIRLFVRSGPHDPTEKSWKRCPPEAR